MIRLLYSLSITDRTAEVNVAVKTIRALRRDRGWTQFELALMVGVQPQAIYLWETGRRTPQVPQLRKLGEIFEMCSDDIVLVQQAETSLARLRPRANRQRGESVSGHDGHDGHEPVTAHGSPERASHRENG